MNRVDSSKKLVQRVLRDFCVEFLPYPYLCYTEHGIHARFYMQLYNAFPVGKRYVEYQGVRLCAVQKQYPTAGRLGKPRGSIGIFV